ncbi:hypothetical protein ACP4OV_016111 [Aristida adscensionis]
MDYDPGGASPDHGGGGGGAIHLVCENCGSEDDYEPDDAENGFFTCRQCAAVHTSTQATAADPHDFPAAGSFSVRRVATQPTPAPKLRPQTPAPYPATPYAAAATPARAPAAPVFDDFAEPSQPRDFALGGGDPDSLAARIRWRYVRGLQVILQRQLEVLVERHRVGALVCAVAGTVWVRWVAASKVFDGMWARQVLQDHKGVVHRERYASGDDRKPGTVKCEWEDDILPAQKDRRRVEFAFLRSLRMLLPVYSTLAICFLACHIAREAILPSDIYRWAMEGKIPYVAAFTEVDRLLGSTLQDCPLDARQLFRPVRVIGAWQLETAAGSIAHRLGLRLPSVNFFAIAQRCLEDLSLPVVRILPNACKIYEWALPAELWLSSNPARIPTRVCVMAILIVTLRILYNINGQGTWEKICEGTGNSSRAEPDTNSAPFMSPGDSNSEEFGVRELLCAFAAAYDKINVAHDYSNDLRSYLKYCKEVIFTGITYSAEEEHLIEIFWDMYKGTEDKNSKERIKSHSGGIEEMTIRNEVNKRYRDGTFVEDSCFSSTSGHDAMQRIKAEMEDHGFHYLPPKKVRKSDGGYLRYRRRRLTGGFVYVAHADYYMLLRAFAKLAEVDIRIMHNCVLKLERRMACIEERIERSLNTLQNLSSETKNELRPVSE